MSERQLEQSRRGKPLQRTPNSTTTVSWRQNERSGRCEQCAADQVECVRRELLSIDKHDMGGEGVMYTTWRDKLEEQLQLAENELDRKLERGSYRRRRSLRCYG